MAKFIVRRPFASLDSNTKLEKPGDVIEINNPSTAKAMQDKKLVWPNYSTKEDKRAMKVQKKTKARIEHDAGPMFYVLQGDKVIDRLRKSEAEQLRDKINGVST